jgi:hypothetical protein
MNITLELLFTAIIKLTKRVAMIETVLKANKNLPQSRWRIEDCEGDNSGNLNGATNVNEKYLGRPEPQGPTHPLYRRYPS